MSWLTVWAPRVRRLEVVLAGRRRRLETAPGGWWSDPSPAPSPGTDYALVLDGSGPFPDPRSPFQPEGVHGPSRTVDHGAFHWSDAGFRPRPLEGGLVYELHVGTFTPGGTFDTAIERLDHLVDLGVTHVEVMPVAAFPGERGWGYDGVDLFAPHRAYGGPEGMKRFVDACHGQDLAVILDVVYNHLGPDGNHLARFGPYFTDRYATPWGAAVNFDGRGSDGVRRFFLDNARSWFVDYHVDGLRIDAVHAILDTSATPFLEELSEETAALGAELGKGLRLIAESDLNDPRLVRERDAGGFGLDAQWCDDFHHALHALLTGERQGYYGDFGRIEDVARALTRGYVYDGRPSIFRGRRHGRPFELPGQRLLGYLQTHDQVGNRARGDRLSALVSTTSLRLGALLVATSPFTPMLFMGEEWGARTPFLYFTDHQDPALAKAVREGRRREFAAFGFKAEEIPDPQAEETFLQSRLDWRESETSDGAGTLDLNRELYALRRRTPELRNGNLDAVRVRFDEEQGWIMVRRGPITIAANFDKERRSLPSRTGTLLLASAPEVTLTGNSVVLPPRSGAVLA